MAESKLLKEAIADAKAVRKTAIENARIALEEAFTPKLQSLLSKKLQAEMEGEDDFEDDIEENVDSSEIGKGEGSEESGTDGKQPAAGANTAHTDLDPETSSQSSTVGAEDSEYEKVDDLTETTEEDDEDVTGATFDVNEEEEFGGEDEFEDELDLESIIRELEADLDDEEDVFESEEVDGEEEFDFDSLGENDEIELDLGDDDEDDFESFEESNHEDDEEFEFDDEIDLDEILREMGYGDDEEESFEDEVEDDSAEMQQELEQAYETIRSLKSTINEVNLLNAKLLYTNKLFRSYDLDNSQKVRVVESLDRTHSVREVKLVYATLAESMSFANGVQRKKVKKITEGLASRATSSTKPLQESTHIIAESTNDMAHRFKQLAGINKQ